jgi:hypothetical protein
MPTSSRELYFQLGMYADDDGFINPKKIMRMVGAADDDLKVLLTKRFVLTFDNGIIVIKHWFIHNTLMKDRYTPTTYSDEKKLIKLKENGAYTENVNKMLTEVKLSEVKLNEVKERVSVASLPTPSFFEDKELQKNMSEKLAIRHSISQTFCLSEIDKFVSYWTEKDVRGKKQRWQGQKFFDVTRRLATWFSRVKSDKPQEWEKPVVVDDMQKKERRTYLKGQLIKTEIINLHG